MKAIGFFYSWSGRRELDTYFGKVAQAFAALGIELKVVLGNELLHPNASLRSLHPYVSEDKLQRFVEAERPDFLFSVNNAGMTARLQQSSRIPIVKWLVDDLPHLFFHNDIPAADRLFEGDSQIICYSTTLAEQIACAAPAFKHRVAWVSHGTSLAGADLQPDYPALPISFIGTCLDHRPFVRVLKAAARRGVADELLRVLETTRQDYAQAATTHASAELAASARDVHVSEEHLKRILADLATSQNRAQGLLEVEDLGLHLFGNDLWLNSLAVTPRLARKFEFAQPANSHDRLLSTYARSKISVNIPNVQNCAGLAVRVFDVMASPSLLISEYHPDSDLFRLFGSDCPVPLYRDFDHLRNLCLHYLQHEEERLDLVRKCNTLIGNRFSVASRLSEMLTAAGITLPSNGKTAEPYRIVDNWRFYGPPSSMSQARQWVKLAGKQFTKRLFSPLLDLTSRARD